MLELIPGLSTTIEKEIVAAYTADDTGLVIGYSLYNELRLTTQIPKKIDVLSSQIDQRTKTIGNVVLQYCGINYDSDTRKMVQMLEVLQNFNSIQDLNYNEFLSFCRDYSKEYNEEVFEQVIAIRKYHKRTIAFLKEVLDFYKIPNNLMQYLSALSEYKHPTMEGIYETTQLF